MAGIRVRAVQHKQCRRPTQAMMEKKEKAMADWAAFLYLVSAWLL